jgi:hypothetical protein
MDHSLTLVAQMVFISLQAGGNEVLKTSNGGHGPPYGSFFSKLGTRNFIF